MSIITAKSFITYPVHYETDQRLTDSNLLDREADALLQAGYHRRAEYLAWLAAERRAEVAA